MALSFTGKRRMLLAAFRARRKSQKIATLSVPFVASLFKAQLRFSLTNQRRYFVCLFVFFLNRKEHRSLSCQI